MPSTAANLSYIAIYNPTLKPLPSPPDADDDEDAEEQAHILFYTSKERAVSRDKMLRQVGLAKALINFSEMFNSNEACNSIHSQTRRMVMFSPEPDFWIHACVEVAKIVKPPPKSKGKEKDKSKLKDQPVQHDYDDASVHDVSLKADIQRGYEQFKLTHGSFTSILSNLGREAIELQLERFWTVWAWSWDLESGYDFGKHLGIPLHPLFRHLKPILDDIPDTIPSDAEILAIVPPYTIPSAKYLASSYPTTLASLILDRLSPLHASKSSQDLPKSISSSDDTLRAKALQQQAAASTSNPTHNRSGSNTFLGMPTVNMDVRKWNWGYLTFGKTTPKASPEVPKPDGDQEKSADPAAPVPPPPPPPPLPDDDDDSASATRDDPPPVELLIPESSLDTVSLHEAVSEELSIQVPPHDQAENGSEAPSSPKSNHSEQVDADESLAQSVVTVKPDTEDSNPSTRPPSPEPEPPHISVVHVNLAASSDGLATVRQPVFSFTDIHRGISLALVGLKYPPDLSSPELHQLAVDLHPLFTRIEEVLEDELLKSTVDILPSATKILQPKDVHILSSRGFTLSSAGFASKSDHLFTAQSLIESSLDVSEVFSRGQNPQHWHVGRRGFPGVFDATASNGETVYLEVFRKEASLTDVDNSLVGIVKKGVE
ncbi:hypothetical protein ONZ45_g4607 [Pleurotus djamor]|nr:hypothetical protein ONZ45_g4607 [Pleurotus djamor]